MATEAINKDLLDGYHPSIGGYRSPSLEEEYSMGKPEGMPSKSACDVVVQSEKELREESQKDDIKIWLEGRFNASGLQNHWMGDNVTLASGFCDSTVDGRGAVIYQEEFYNGDMLKSAYGTAPSVFGISFVGPMVDVSDIDNERDIDDVYFDPRDESGETSDYYTSAVWSYDTKGVFEVKGCEFIGWPVAGVRMSARNYPTDAEIRWNTFRDCCMETLGYGVTQLGSGHLWVDKCLFSRCRHFTAGTGGETEETEITDCLTDTRPTVSHQFDKHETTAQANTGGHHFYMRNCTLRSTQDIFGNGEEGYKQRGVPVYEDRLWNNHFWHEDEPTNAGGPGEAIYQEGQDDWKNLRYWNNIYGADENPDKTKYGAPPDPKQEEQTIDTRPLSVVGSGRRSEYEIVVAGDASLTKSSEGNENVEELSEGLVELTGSVSSGSDEFRISGDATLVSAMFSEKVKIYDGKRQVNLEPLIAAWVYENYKN